MYGPLKKFFTQIKTLKNLTAIFHQNSIIVCFFTIEIKHFKMSSLNDKIETRMYSEENRLKSFSNWPHNSGNITKKEASGICFFSYCK